MARSDVMVSQTGRAEPRCSQDRLHRGRRGHRRNGSQPHRGRDQARLAQGPAGRRPPRLPEPGAVLRTAVRPRASRTTTPRVLYGGNKTGCGLRVLVLQAVRPPGRHKLIDGGRKKWELDGRPLSKETVTARPPSTRPQRPTPRRAFRDDVIAAIGSANRVDVRSPDEYSGKISRAGAPAQEQAQPSVATSRRHQIRGAPPPTRTAPSSRTPTSRSCTRTRDSTRPRTPSPTAVSASARATPGSCCRRSSEAEVKNYDGSWVEYGSLVGAPIELGA